MYIIKNFSVKYFTSKIILQQTFLILKVNIDNCKNYHKMESYIISIHVHSLNYHLYGS